MDNNSKGSGTDLTKDQYKRSGQIVFRMANFKAFSEGNVSMDVYSDTTEYINGLPWRIQIKYQRDHIWLNLRCDGDSDDMAWSCQAVYELSVVSSTTNDECLARKGNCVFKAVEYPAWGWRNFAKFEELMDPRNGIYDAKGDTVTFKAQLTAERPRRMPGLRTEDALLVNGKVVYVNKHSLASYSEFFRNLFFGPMAEQMPNVQIDDIEDAVKSFGRLIGTMPPQNLELDDECAENVLKLANRFLIDSVENRCVNFWMKNSKKSAIFKFRLAHQYGLIGMKVKILDSMTKRDFAVAEENHYDILLEHDKMDAEATQELRSRYEELFGTK